LGTKFFPRKFRSARKGPHDNVDIAIYAPKLVGNFPHSSFSEVPFNGNTYSLGNYESKPVTGKLFGLTTACI